MEIKTESVTDDVEGGIEAPVADEVRRAGMAGELAHAREAGCDIVMPHKGQLDDTLPRPCRATSNRQSA